MVILPEKEELEVRYNANKDGIFVSFRDSGGTLGFDSLERAIGRCYGSSDLQIENKESGAGLGIYLVFEATTHLKVVCEAHVSTVVSCWISNKNSFHPRIFSFNYFQRGHRDSRK